MNLHVNIKVLHKDAQIPKYAKEGDSGFDLLSIKSIIVEQGETVVVPTGLAFGIPSSYELQVRPKSGISSKTNFLVILGTVDSGYTGEVGVIAKNIGTVPYIIHKGDKVAQGVIAPVMRAVFYEVNTLANTDRGTGGFGSTGF